MSHNIDPIRIEQLQRRWDDALAEVAGEVYEYSGDDPADALEKNSQQNFRRQYERMIMGVAGPGAAGKGTLGKIILSDLGFTKIVNTTTRAKREGEQDGRDYYFIGEGDFVNTQQHGQFALSLERPGRGLYGITNDEIRTKLNNSIDGCLFEENPQNILELFENESLGQSVDKALLYVLPPRPIIETTMGRLQKRLNDETDPDKRVLTSENFESTLGDRQIDEFLAIKEVKKNPSVQPIFLIMHTPEQGGQDIAKILKKPDNLL